jgi:hypothetical protein
VPIRSTRDLDNDPAVRELLVQLPDHLYRYLGFSGYRRRRWMKQLIVDSQAYAAKPREFNDPLDCRVRSDLTATTPEMCAFWRERIQDLYPNVRHNDSARFIDALVNEAQTADGRERIGDRALASIQERGVVSLSETATNMLLWSYYAEGHRGIAVRFNMAFQNIAAIERRALPLRVEYADSFPTLSLFTGSTVAFVTTAFRTKARCWTHEDEWRLLFLTPGPVRLPPSMIDGIVFGMRIVPKNEARLRKWVAGRVPAIELLRVKQRPDSYDLDLVPA